MFLSIFDCHVYDFYYLCDKVRQLRHRAPCRRKTSDNCPGVFIILQLYMNKENLWFVTYCISKLAATLNLPQREVYRRLLKSGILYDYMIPSYDVLHTFGSHYLMDDLTDYMREKGVLPS